MNHNTKLATKNNIFKCVIDHPSCGGRCDHIQDSLKFLSVLNEENRLRIICVLSNTQGYTVSQIVEGVELPQNLVSHHLKSLFDLGVVSKNKSGLNVFYTLNQDKIDEYSTSLMTLLNHKIKL